ncbi:ABC transporter ATP-binding protein [Ascidiimonas sp. W6]|uniref:ABC transporter ATP-binding protein n=1 Tax=Ascidiimonas meishanensis TaxID=3128903 RepID=UPI0030EBD347
MLTLNNISFGYDKDVVLKNIHLNIPQGNHVSIIGASGCGKSTLLKLIYGLYTPLTGSILRNETQLLGPDFNIVPGEDFMKYVAQDFDLMPYTTAQENVGKYLSNFYPEEKKQRSLELLETVEMVDFSNVKVRYLSGGQQQRIALARALAREPEILLLDEPFSHIDNFQKNSLRRKLFAYLKEKNITCLVATHDSTDALSFADHAVVLKQGELIANGAPQILYENPPTPYVASLFDEVNVLDSSIFDPKLYTKDICIYPHELKIGATGIFRVKIITSYFKGNFWLIESKFQGNTLFFENETFLKKDTTHFLQVNEAIIKKRLQLSTDS